MRQEKNEIGVELNRRSFYWLLIGFFVIGVLFSSYFAN